MNGKVILFALLFVFATAGCNQVFDNPPSSDVVVDHSSLLGEWETTSGMTIQVSEGTGNEALDINLDFAGEQSHDLRADLTEVNGKLLASFYEVTFPDKWFIVRVVLQDDKLFIDPVNPDSLLGALDLGTLTGDITARGTGDEFISVSSSPSDLKNYFSNEESDFVQDAEDVTEFTRSHSAIVTNSNNEGVDRVFENRWILAILVLVMIILGLAMRFRSKAHV